MTNLKFTLDAFATRYNQKVKRWCGPGSPINEDGLQHPWRGETVLAHPPIPLIVPVLMEAIKEKARVLLLMPDWKGQIWEPILNRMRTFKWTWRNHAVLLKPGIWMIRTEANLPPGKMRVVLLNP
ncbi:uncharacterized protein MONOS_6875 [Monocercomonoides exilis]|uniref:uncharacterized protein n=1 Tax=Monocercomonoides exilis TaxID=2049356 RepID=UPI00355A6B98|nr:hypothetical protein MONOS_6875 [Monocercomonoides exilis]|eukprot:MONOS_6875.1-p1 / transcript=MONOS_6875.1 / gene=MONOS_6875 / organism=Monocercomonoides_exilis_PA203 / gene_product=unspecified product / transcript_product=unspecified product / location=Mono_scaffold00225:39499-39873(-) / protein_length=125 / sequence_SO=supercontig / SO=protein_coding / is_pseudo=false